MSVDKKSPPKEESEESMGSSPEGEAPAQPPASAAPAASSTPAASNDNNASGAGVSAQQPENQQPKRKGGRKPIYATSEERKQRNRQAQAAFRERRTEYIKQLEEAIRTHEQNLANLQAAHRHAADECLMLRYKNSLLERIDVQAELRAKTGSPNLGPTHIPQPTIVQPPPIQRPIINRHHPRRSNSGIAPKIEPGINVTPLPPPLQPHSALSPTNRPTPSSHSASPPGTASFGSQHAPSPAGSDHLNPSMRPTPPSGPVMKATPPQMGPPVHGLPTPRSMHQPIGGLQHSVNNQPRPSEYDAAADMIDDTADTPDTPSGPGPYPGPPYPGDPQPMSLSSPVTTGPPGSQPMAGQSPMDSSVAHGQHGTYPSMTQLLDTSYDFDPFGLSASMAFPTQFSFDTSNMR
ncbi:putative sequence-specific DNA binding protein [Thermochaetoides thermophila DSM 1495]|uniref:Putative sequence-specific DNA binding protein n=1 Tax=Chaetomium thermophilum (strain DSM 1495 / CBS 144.50 / IMI 039719) TaxID=759272 RepID=G0S429_CHATD|nr:putative sequence-specific DNA binding protein [Thermochaetoides thermophila DSM 1495]EGS20405.1 putative sequence-specific DNA binding protein [Thermochaetoides thermophila DSM 1495]